MSILRVASLQLELKKTNNFKYVVEAIEKCFEDDKSIELIVLSELAVGGAGAKNTNYELNKYLEHFQKLAQKLNVWLIPGTFYENDNGQIFNTAPIINSNGELVTKAQKLYPWLPYECDVAHADNICVFEMPDKGFVGVHICYDLWFPETSRALALAGAELIINPTLTPTKDRDIETLMVRTTAAQQQLYYIDVNSCGDQGCGKSIVADPHGNIMHNSGNDEDIFIVDIDFNEANNSRRNGFMGLGQNLKSYRDKPFNNKNTINKNYLDNLGKLEINKDQ